ncbi:hypothetical protein N9N29_06905 [Amylibacter sp.]|nr:hypothetical protein [Amylibacter sp.]
MKILALLSMIFFTSPLLAQGTNSCPNRGLDPNTFCVPGMIWNEELKTCVTMA